MRRDQGTAPGFVLLNALILVAVLAAAAVFVLGRAEGARLRQASLQTATQAGFYLDGFEALALALLRRDQQGGAMDGSDDAWAGAVHRVEIDRGQVTGRIDDLQGRFNINWLANPADLAAFEGFGRLLAALGMRPELAAGIARTLHPDGPAQNRQAYARLRPPVAPVGGPVLLVEQLRQIPALSPRDYNRLAPYLAALPSDSQLNVNTAAPQVLQSLLPGLKSAGLDQLVQERATRPFMSVEAFLERARPFLGDAGLAEGEDLRLAVGSDWFAADIAVELDGLVLQRVTVFERRPLPYGPRVAYRLEATP